MNTASLVFALIFTGKRKAEQLLICERRGFLLILGAKKAQLRENEL